MCCGQKRQALRSAPSSGKTPISVRQSMLRASANRPSTAHIASEIVRQFNEPSAAASRGLALAPDAPRTPVTLRYVRTAPMRVAGEGSGRQYEFSGSRPIQTVDPRDLFQLLSMGYFSRT
jgi:hypothetical protein